MSTPHLIVDIFLWWVFLMLAVRALWNWWVGPTEEKGEYQTLIDDLAKADESAMYMHQNLNEADRKAERMTKYRTKAGMDELSMKAAVDIEDVFIRANFNGREGRLKDAQKVVRKALSEVLSGTDYYKGE